MPRPLRELTADAEASGNWDAVADWCENFDWSEAEEIPVAEHYLRCAAATRPQDEAKLIAAVSAARTAGTPWPRIAEILASSPQAVQKQYAPLIEAAAANQ